MGGRMCPRCRTGIPAPEAAARSNDMVCPNCGARLEVGPGSRMISSVAGLAAGAIAWKLSTGGAGDLAAVLPTLYAVLAFGIVSPLVLILIANLRNAPPAPAAAPAHEPVAHAASGHAHSPAHH